MSSASPDPEGAADVRFRGVLLTLLGIALLLVPFEAASKLWLATVLVLGFVLVLDAVSARRTPFAGASLAVPLLVLTVIAAVAGLFSTRPGYSMRQGLEVFGTPLILYLATLRAVNLLGRGQEPGLRSALSRWALFVGVPSVLALLGTVVYGFSAMAVGHGGAAGDQRFHGGHYWYAEAARYLEVAVFLCAGFAAVAWYRGRKAIGGFVVVVTTLGLIALAATKTKGAFAGFGAGMLALGLFQRRFALLIGGTVIAAGLALLVPGIRAEAAKMVSFSRFTEASATAPFRYRPHGWSYAWDRFLERPVLGHGVGGRLWRADLIENGQTIANVGDDALRQHVGQEEAADLPIVDHPHNFVLQLVYEMGLIGLIAFGVLVVRVVVGIRGRFVIADPETAVTLSCVAAATVALLVHGLVSSVYTDPIFALLVVAMAVVDLPPHLRRRSPTPGAP